jgi:hypothetical protein
MPLDFILWGFLKERVYRKNSRILEDLNVTLNRLLPALTYISSKKLHKSTVKRVNACLEGGEDF